MENIIDKKFIEKSYISFNSKDEMIAVATKLTEMGYELWASLKRLYDEVNTYTNGGYYSYDGQHWLRSCDYRPDTITADEFLKMCNNKYKKKENPIEDPYGEEDWGWEEIKENNKNQHFKVGDRVKYIYNDYDTDSWYGKNRYYFDLNGVVLDYRDGGRIGIEFDNHLGNDGHTCNGLGKPGHCQNILPEYLKKMGHISIKKIEKPDIDPYGEEDWGWEEMKENVNDVKNTETRIIFNDLLGIYFNGEYNIMLNWLNDNLTKKRVYFISEENEIYKKFDSWWIVDNYLAGTQNNIVGVMMTNKQYGNASGLIYLDEIELPKVKYKKLENPIEDPYNEEDWGYEEIKDKIMIKYKDFINEVARSRELDKFKFVDLHPMINDHTMDTRRSFIDYINKNVLGKMILFYNQKDNKNIKKERICNGAYWDQDANGNWQLFIIGTKKDYAVNLLRPIGYYVEWTPSKNLELDPYGEEDWG